MSLDILARQASHDLVTATADLDVNDALRTTLDGAGRRRRIVPALAIVTAVIVLIVGWALSGELRRSAVPAPPVDAPSPVLVGSQLGAPMSAVAPSGWDVINDSSYVELHATDGSQARIVMVVPHEAYNPPAYELVPMKDDPALWTTTHPGLTTSGKFGVDGPGFAWAGTKADLSLSDKAGTESIPLVPLTKGAATEDLSISADDQMFRWTVIYFEGSDPLAIAAISPKPDDPNLHRSINELLESIQIEQK